MGSIDWDRSQWPIVIVEMQGQYSDEYFAEYLAELSELTRTSVGWALIIDASRADRSPASQRRMQAEWMKEHRPWIRMGLVGTAFVIRSRLVRGGLTAIFWVQPMASPHTVVATRGEALAWCRKELRAAGPPGGTVREGAG